jgi:excisionase family DNA binding protein
MNAEIRRLFADYLLEAKDPTAAAVLVLADVLRQEPVIIEPDDRQTYGVKEAAELLRTSSKKVYQMCLAGKLRCVRISGRVRIPITEIECFDVEAIPASTAPVAEASA